MAANITFNNLRYLGKPIRSAADGWFKIGPYTSNIRFTIDRQKKIREPEGGG
jgi:hypothetical protein